MTEPYGLPTGASISYGATGFPGWVYRLCGEFGLQASTYPGHQENNRPDIGSAPNPNRLNRGIDWTGPPDNMLRFARWLRDTAPAGLEMVIFAHPHSGEGVWFPTWVNFSGDLSGHRDHVHTRHSQSIGEGGAPPVVVREPLWGIDISNHQGEMDIAQVKREGFAYLWAKVSESNNYRDPFWPRNRDLARQHGLLLAGYHYVRTTDPMSQARLFTDHLGDKTIPAMLDFEDGSGNIDQFWAVKKAIESLGVRVALSYIPDWYWERIGRPDLSKVPGLIASEYVTGTDYASRLYPGDHWHGWKAYGGRTPDLLQFTSSAQVAGKTVDAMAFKGTRADLERLLAGHPKPPIEEEDLMSALSPEEQRRLLERTDQLWGAVFNPVTSKSRYGDPKDEWASKDFWRNDDGFLFDLITEHDAALGDATALARIHKAAAAGDVLAQNFLTQLSASSATPVTAPTVAVAEAQPQWTTTAPFEEPGPLEEPGTSAGPIPPTGASSFTSAVEDFTSTMSNLKNQLDRLIGGPR